MNKKTSREEKAKFWKAQIESIIKYEIGSNQSKILRELVFQEFIANSVNIRTASISDFENGKTSLKINILRDICNVLNITMKDFFDFDTTTPSTENIELITEISSHLADLDSKKLKYIKTMIIMFKQD